LIQFVGKFVDPNGAVYEQQLNDGLNYWDIPPILEEMKGKSGLTVKDLGLNREGLVPDRIQHCMRLIGAAERVLENMRKRVKKRVD
jgi:hypothetical protein